MLETVKLTKRFNGHAAVPELNRAIKPGQQDEPITLTDDEKLPRFEFRDEPAPAS